MIAPFNKFFKKSFLFFITFLSFTLMFSRNSYSDTHDLKDNQNDILNTTESNQPKSRLIIKSNEKKIKKYITIKKKIKPKDVKTEKNIIVKKKNITSTTKEIKVNKKKVQITVNFDSKTSVPSAKELKNFINKISLFNNKNSIIIKGYAEKKENDSTSSVRRLSLKRALFLRSLLLKNNFKISKIYVKALGYDKALEGTKDIVVVSEN